MDVVKLLHDQNKQGHRVRGSFVTLDKTNVKTLVTLVLSSNAVDKIIHTISFLIKSSVASEVISVQNSVIVRYMSRSKINERLIAVITL